jgi:hypothetical protein
MNGHARERMFWFRGNTLAVGGRIEGPIQEVVDPQGACVLPPTGGFDSATVHGFNHRNIIRFDRATSMVSGQKVRHGEELAGETLVTVAIERLNILDVLTADRVVVRMSSLHLRGEEGGRTRPEILPFGSHFDNLRIGGVPIDLRPYKQLAAVGRHETLTDVRGKREFPWIRTDGDECSGPGQWLKAKSGAKSRKFDPDQVLMAPLFRMDDACSKLPVGLARKGQHGISIPGLGVVYFGEYLITPSSRRLTMLRIELGCPISGCLTCGSCESNGHWDP